MFAPVIRSIARGRANTRLVPAKLGVSWNRGLHATAIRSINPLLPFDVLEEVQNDELEQENSKLARQKKRLLKQKKKAEKKLKEAEETGKFETVNDSVPKAKAVVSDLEQTDVVQLGESSADQYLEFKEKIKQETINKREATIAAAAAGGSGGSNNGGDGDKPEPPVEEEGDKEAEEKEVKEQEEQKKKQEQEEEQTKKEDEEYEYEEYAEEPQSKFKHMLGQFGRFLFKCLETMGITFSSVGILGVAGYVYHKVYNEQVLDKIDKAFATGDPAYQLAIHKKTNKHIEHDDCEGEDLTKFWVERPQQQLLDDIISGKIVGRYYLIIGEKGTGKTTLLLESMKKVNGTNVAIFDAHADPEIFRIRLGKALNFAYSEDYIGSLFSIRGPRDTTALLDIERAFSKLEELSIKRRMKDKNFKPLIMIINNSHLIKENEEGIKLIELLQQKAESLSGSGLLTIIFNSDDYWVYEKLKKLGTRLELINVRDFNRAETVSALKFIREKFFPSFKYPELKLNNESCNKIYDLIGGRPQHISQVARHRDIIRACHEIIDREKTWLLNQCGLLGMDMDDDVMESGKFSSSCMLLVKEFVEMDKARENHNLIIHGGSLADDQVRDDDHHLPELPLWRARQIMTRPDYIQQYDNLNIFTIDSELRVRADSIPMMRGFHEILSQPHFNELLDDTIQRVADIESLARTREVLFKDLNLGSKYEIVKKLEGNKIEVGVKRSAKQIEVHGQANEIPLTEQSQQDNSDDDIEMMLEDINRKDSKKWWKKRMGRFDDSTVPKKSNEYDIDLNRE